MALELWHDKKSSWLSNQDMSDALEDQLQVQSNFSMVSHGTERTVISQQIDESLAQKMAVPYMKGSLVEAFTYGYSLVGQVMTKHHRLYQRKVHLMHPHQDVCLVDEASLTVLPEHIDLKEATLASNLETAINAIWDANVSLGDRVIVYGYGLIGALIATILKHSSGISCHVSETNETRRKLYLEHGLKGEEDVKYDVAFNTTAKAEVLQKAFSITHQDGRIIELSWYGNNSANLMLGTDFHYGRKQLISSQVSQIPRKMQPRWNYQLRKQLVFNLLNELDFSHLIDGEVSYNSSPAFYKKLRMNKIENISTIISY